ncbi:helix-turn-helix transcriptional regulator [Chryseomicrobium sp. FSL W7-1435]|uniref:helix-turn-helix domain-containing protein n=1 Tax=Chryseomicrobium sp. FSL W7-1435 TaxID=2921704 RepID=UPI00315B0852
MTLGERIRTLRKERKMTLQQLAADAITKGMLSLIENNKAKPSMESLQHIATMLNVSVSDLLEDSSSPQKKEVVKEGEDLFRKIDYSNLTAFTEITSLIEPLLATLGRGYLDARLLDLYARAAYETNLADWETSIEKAILLYEEIQVARRAASLRLFRISVKFREKQYQQALEQLLKEREAIEEHTLWSDPLLRLDFDYSEAVFYYAVGQKEKALETMHAAIDFSKQQKVFYRLDHLYRLAVVHAIMAGDKQEAETYISRLKAYALFTDDKEIEEFTQLIWIHYNTSYSKDIERADELMTKLLQTSKPLDQLDFERVEYAKIAYYKGNLALAQQVLEETPPAPSFVSHPVDLSLYSEREYYLALIYLNQGDTAKALEVLETSWDQLQHFPETPYQTRMKKLREDLLKDVQ